MPERTPKPTIIKREDCVVAANLILERHAPAVPRVNNVGRALLLIALHYADRDLDYRDYEQRWTELRSGSSYAEDDALPFAIVATEAGAVEIRKTGDCTTPLDELLGALDTL